MLLSGESLTPSRIGQFQALFFLLESTFLADIGVILVLWLSRVQLFAIPLAAAQQASLSFTISQTLLKLMSIELVMPSNYLILCHPLLLPSLFPSLRVFSNESALHISIGSHQLFTLPQYWSFNSASVLPMNISGLISFRIDWFYLLAVQGTLKSLLQHNSLKASILADIRGLLTPTLAELAWLQQVPLGPG